MQNKCGSCNQQGFVPVSGNWNFSKNGEYGCNRRRNESGCQNRSGCQADMARGRDCQCERRNDDRNVENCSQNTYVRDMPECAADYGRMTCTGENNCPCEACTRRRARSEKAAYDKDCGCAEAAASSRAGGKQDNGAAYGRDKNRHVGMVKGYWQEIDEIFRSESALRAGTLFPELHKPLNGYCPCDDYCGTCAQEAAFAAWELRLYLNTHPHDENALALFRKLCKETKEENYATAFLTDEGCTDSWNWVSNPWPWEFDCKCGD